MLHVPSRVSACRPLVFFLKREPTITYLWCFLTQFVGNKWVSLHSVAELVSLTTDQHWDVRGLGHHSNHGRTNTWLDVTIGEQGVGTKEHFRYLGKGRLRHWISIFVFIANMKISMCTILLLKNTQRRNTMNLTRTKQTKLLALFTKMFVVKAANSTKKWKATLKLIFKVYFKTFPCHQSITRPASFSIYLRQMTHLAKYNNITQQNRTDYGLLKKEITIYREEASALAGFQAGPRSWSNWN